jgi:hypothetical protein
MNSPSAEASSSPTGRSRLVTTLVRSRISSTCAGSSSASLAISSVVGSRPSLVASSRSTRITLRSRWATWFGTRIVRSLDSSARWIA